MKADEYTYAELDKQALEKVQKLETELGSYLIAFEPKNAIAKLTDAQIAQLEKLEKELKVMLIAYKR
jgi:triosephosphate isomerase